MNDDKDKVDMRYEGDKSQRDKLECVFTYRGKEYRVMYYFVAVLSDLYDLPGPVQEYMLTWAKMLNNPD